MVFSVAFLMITQAQIGSGRRIDTQIKNPQIQKNFTDLDFGNQSLPKVRSTNFILQDNPEGITELARSVKQGKITGECLRGIFTPSELSRFSSTVLRGRSAGTIRNQVGLRSNKGVAKIFEEGGFTPDTSVKADPLDFGTKLKGDAPGTMVVGFNCTSTGKVNFLIRGSFGYSVEVIKTTQYVPGDGNSGGYEKTVEYNGSSFPATEGMHYDLYVKFNPSQQKEGNSLSTLSIYEPTRRIEVPLKASVMTKSLAVTVNSTLLSVPKISPKESIDITVNMTVNQNSGSQLVFRMLSPVKGISMASESQWVAKSGSTIQKLRLNSDINIAESASTPVTIGIFPVGGTTPLSTFTVNFAVQREWLEWNYQMSAGKQEITGKFQLASTGEYIWTIDAYNSSVAFADNFFTAVCFTNLYPGPRSPGCSFMFRLPIKDNSHIHAMYTGQMGVNFNEMKSKKIRHYLALDEGGPLAAIGDFGQGVVDLVQSQTGKDIYDKIPDNFGGKVIKWSMKYHYQPLKVATAKAWL